MINSDISTKDGESEKYLILSEDKSNSTEGFGDTACKSVTEIPESQVKKCSTEITVNKESVCSSEKTFIEKASLNAKQDLTKNYPLPLYPDLKLLHHCGKVHSILSSQTLVRTDVEKFEKKTVVEANKSFKDFVKVSMPFFHFQLMYNDAPFLFIITRPSNSNYLGLEFPMYCRLYIISSQPMAPKGFISTFILTACQ